jgi:hypothetical protein
MCVNDYPHSWHHLSFPCFSHTTAVVAALCTSNATSSTLQAARRLEGEKSSCREAASCTYMYRYVCMCINIDDLLSYLHTAHRCGHSSHHNGPHTCGAKRRGSWRGRVAVMPPESCWSAQLLRQLRADCLQHTHTHISYHTYLHTAHKCGHSSHHNGPHTCGTKRRGSWRGRVAVTPPESCWSARLLRQLRTERQCSNAHTQDMEGGAANQPVALLCPVTTAPLTRARTAGDMTTAALGNAAPDEHTCALCSRLSVAPGSSRPTAVTQGRRHRCTGLPAAAGSAGRGG